MENMKNIIFIALIVIGSLIGVWGIYAIIITCPLPLSEGYVVNLSIQPYREYKDITRESIKRTVHKYNSLTGKDEAMEIHDYYLVREYLVKDYIDYVVTIRGKRIANYILWKSEKVYNTDYFITKDIYDSLYIEASYDNQLYKGKIFDENNERILLRSWRE